MTWETVIGLEVHVQLKTQTKIFSGSPTAFGAEPNTQANIVDLAMPGVLPVLNKEVVKMAVKLGLSVNAQINHESVFARKNYFYPDLPKGYQISQHMHPIVGEGELKIIKKDGEVRKIGIERAHLEEDAGKSLHENFHGKSGIDLNRAGTPLLEIVSRPDMRSAKEAVLYLKTLHSLVVYLGICDGNMQEGSFRCDANVSIRKKGDPLGTRTETKNLNSFRFVERAINYEVDRQKDILEDGGVIAQETRLYDAANNTTRTMRSKEEANDYRYFPEPDLLPLIFDDAFVSDIKNNLPELPEEKRQRFMQDYKLPAYDAGILVSSKAMADYYEMLIKESQADPKLAANWLLGDFSAALNKENMSIEQSPVSATDFALLIMRIEDNTISGSIAKTVFESMWSGDGSADAIIKEKGLKQITDSGAIAQIIDDIIANNPNQLEQYRSGKDKLFGFFVGQVMKASKGKANPQQVNQLLKEKL